MKTNGNYVTKNTNDTGRCDTAEELIGEMHIFQKKKNPDNAQKRQKMEKNTESMQNIVKHLTNMWLKSQQGRNNEKENPLK